MAGEQILIADDEPDVLDVARMTLELEGFRIITANDGAEAVEVARRSPVDLLLTDVKMPRMDGLDAFQKIHDHDPTVVGVAMTGYGTMKIAIQALQRGFAEFVVKPFTPDDLVGAVTRSLEKERLRRENLRLRALIPLFELSNAFMRETRIEVLLERVVSTALTETGASRAILFLRQPEGEFSVAAHAGEPLGDDRAWQRLSSWVLRTGQPLVLDPRSPSLPVKLSPTEGSALALPLLIKERPVGVLVLDKAPDAEPFVDGDAELLSVLASQAAVAIENARLFAEKERAFRELETMDHLKSEFINIAAHELRTPLSLVLGYAGLLEEESDEDTVQYARSITHNAMRLRAIVDDMTSLRYLEMNQARLDYSRVDVGQLVRRSVEVLDHPALHDLDLTVDVKVPEGLPIIEVDVQKFDLVLGNLLSNAYKFSPRRGTVTVWVRERPDSVVVSVSDQGPGIPLEEQSKIWRRFYQVEESLTRQHGGMGLGLAIVKGMVELHEGRAWVESVDGQGSTFHMSLPKKRPVKSEDNGSE